MLKSALAKFLTALAGAGLLLGAAPATAIDGFSAEDLHYSVDSEALRQRKEEFNVRKLLDECRTGNPRSCLILGKACVEQYHIANEISYVQHAYDLFEQACSLHDSEGCYRRGTILLESVRFGLDTGRLFDLPKPRDIIIQSLRSGTTLQDNAIVGNAYARLAELYQSDDREKVIEYSAEGCKAGNNDACFLWGEAIWLSRVEERDITKYVSGSDPDEAMISAFSRGTNSETIAYRSRAYYFLGYQYGLKRYFDLALQAYNKGCEMNNANACFFAGIAYEDGRGASRDMKMAFKNYDRACSLGNSYGCERVRKLKLQGY